MFPILFQIGNIKFYSYAIFIALAYLCALGVSIWFGKKVEIPATKIIDLVFISFVFGLLGSRILFVLTMREYFHKYPSEVFFIWQGGMVYFGGLISAVLFLLLYLRRQGADIWLTFDVLAMGLVIAHAVGRIACLGAGCCHGRACSLPWAIKIRSSMVDPNLRDIPVHPTQAYEAIGLLCIFFILLVLWNNRARKGTITLAYLFTYSLLRILVEYYRGDNIRGFVFTNLLSTSQFIAILMIILSALMWRWRPSGNNL